jgi:flavin-dependent thymidylate synthase
MSTNLVGNSILQEAIKVAPKSLANREVLTLPNFLDTKIVEPIFPEEIWLSFLLDSVSRGLSHEWVRHKFQTAISQRSTRYVDESESDWVWHPLVLKYQDQIEKSLHNWSCYDKWVLDTLSQNVDASQGYYETMVEVIEKEMISENVDKFTARKQARGAARGVLGNSLATEMIWSGSLAQIIRIIKQRATEAADAEIRLLANEMYEIVQPLYPQYFINTVKQPCPDGIGYTVVWK